MSELTVWCTLPTKLGNFRMYDTGQEGLRLITMGDPWEITSPPLLRIHSSCLASEVFGAQDCDCADQLMESMKLIATEENGMVIHLHQEGRGHGLSHKIQAVRIMETHNFDTVEAFNHLDLEQDPRVYDGAVQLLRLLGIESVRLISNNPRKKKFLEGHGIEVKEVRTHPIIRPMNHDYLHSKNEKLGHSLPLESNDVNIADIRFYHSDQRWGEFSNFSAHSVHIDGLTWRTVEHYYQGMKFPDSPVQELVRVAETPTLAKKIATENKDARLENWNHIKEDVMLKALREKFRQHPELAEYLRGTRGRRLVEFTDNDSYWGESENGTGSNRLGELLMLVRDEINMIKGG